MARPTATAVWLDGKLCQADPFENDRKPAVKGIEYAKTAKLIDRVRPSAGEK